MTTRIHGPCALTADGGFAVEMVNKTGAASVKGSVVEPSNSTKNGFVLAGASSYDPVGIVYESGVADGDNCLVVIGGLAYVLLEDTTSSTMENWVGTSTAQAGRADATTAAPPGAVLAHFREVGHCLETVVGGADKLALCMIHFL